AVRTAMDDYQSAIAKAATVLPDRTGMRVPPSPLAVRRSAVAADPAPGPAPAEHSGLTRRVPGANLAPGLRSQRIPKVSRAPDPGAAPADPAAWTAIARRTRDPDAERAALDAFAKGLARADKPPDNDPTASRDTDSTKGSTA
ncbi:MAG TPA: hypothetical protein VGX25_33445, partial [Actinophytocola sp.]|nr:hypothetical protein [Actinophytocola sp.]